jgi:DNA mismatch endonuclease, patch repair protein
VKAPAFNDVSEATRRSMRANKGKDTRPEMIVRSLVHGMGYRYRLHRKDLPGKPDLVFRPRKKAIFVHGCFWHLHSSSECKGARIPETRVDYWKPKLEGNRARDARNQDALRSRGWDVLTVWECELKRMDETAAAIDAFLGGSRRGAKR